MSLKILNWIKLPKQKDKNDYNGEILPDENTGLIPGLNIIRHIRNLLFDIDYVLDNFVTRIKFLLMKDRFIQRYIFPKRVNIDPDYKQVDEYIRAGHYEKALGLITRSLTARPHDQEMLFNMAVISCIQDDSENALAVLERMEEDAFLLEKALLKDFINISGDRPLKYTNEILKFHLINANDLKVIAFNPGVSYFDVLIDRKTESLDIADEKIREMALDAHQESNDLLAVILGRIYYNRTKTIDPVLFRGIGLSMANLGNYQAAADILYFTYHQFLHDDPDLGIMLAHLCFTSEFYKKTIRVTEYLIKTSEDMNNNIYFASLFLLIFSINSSGNFNRYSLADFLNLLIYFVVEETRLYLVQNDYKELTAKLESFNDTGSTFDYLLTDTTIKEYIPERSRIILTKFFSSSPPPDEILDNL